MIQSETKKSITIQCDNEACSNKEVFTNEHDLQYNWIVSKGALNTRVLHYEATTINEFFRPTVNLLKTMPLTIFCFCSVDCAVAYYLKNITSFIKTLPSSQKRFAL